MENIQNILEHGQDSKTPTWRHPQLATSFGLQLSPGSFTNHTRQTCYVYFFFPLWPTGKLKRLRPFLRVTQVTWPVLCSVGECVISRVGPMDLKGDLRPEVYKSWKWGSGGDEWGGSRHCQLALGKRHMDEITFASFHLINWHSSSIPGVLPINGH